jgi:S-adenosylmethionine:tRNA ribosyltransferase-isomerase
MKLSEYFYDLPEGLIASEPPRERGSSRLLVLGRDTGEIMDKNYRDLPEFLGAGDVLVLNDTKVMPARIIAEKSNGAKRELIILEKRLGDADWHRHKVLHRGSLRAGDKLRVGEYEIVVEEVLGDGVAMVSAATDLLEIADKYGAPPLPPYMRREANARDIERYQTVFAREMGSAAAPTASLNMTEEILEKLRERGVRVVYLTLHVGLGTFLPIRTDEVTAHKMHAEYFSIPSSTVKALREARANGGRVVAVGTTVTRTLEYAAEEIFSSGEMREITGEADIFIYPGYEFKAVDALLTNFHAPKSTVLMMAAAFAGKERLFGAYEHAKKQDYRFLSYGDSMLVL